MHCIPHMLGVLRNLIFSNILFVSIQFQTPSNLVNFYDISFERYTSQNRYYIVIRLSCGVFFFMNYRASLNFTKNNLKSSKIGL